MDDGNGRDPDDDDELEENGEPDDDDGEFDDDDDEFDDDEEPEDLAAAATTAAVPLEAPAPGAPALEIQPTARDPRSRFRTLTDSTVAQLVVLDHRSHKLASLRPPYPHAIERWIADTYGVGKYRLVQRDERGKHIGSRTVKVGESRRWAPVNRLPNGNGNGNGVHYEPPPPPAPGPTTNDWRLALVTTGLPLIATAMQSFAAAMSKPRGPSDLEMLVKAAELLKVPNEERGALFREGMKLAAELRESRGGSEDSSPIDFRGLLAGVAELIGSFRRAQPAPGPPPTAAPAAPHTAIPAPRGASPASALETPKPSADPQKFVEQVLFSEINRAVSSGDTPECFVILLGSWLPDAEAWILSSSDEDVLESLPQRFPQHAEYMAQPTVQSFLRAALQMIREDAAADEESDGVFSADPGIAEG